MKATLDGQRQAEKDSVFALTGIAGTVDEDEEPNVGQTVDAATAGFPAEVLNGGSLLFTHPPPEAVLAIHSECANQLKGREIIRHFKGHGWCIGRVLKSATDATVKDGKRIANFRVFYEADDELLNQSLYSSTYAKNASSAVGMWMVIARRAELPALMAPRPERLALMPPNRS